MKSWEEEEKPEPKHCCLDFIKTLATKEEVFGLCEKSSASPSTNEAYIFEKDDFVGLEYNSLFRSNTRLLARTCHMDASAETIKKLFKEKLGLRVRLGVSQSVSKVDKKNVLTFTVVFNSNEDLLTATKLNGVLLPNTNFPLFLQRTHGRLILFSVTGYDCSLSEPDLKAKLAEIFGGCKNLVNSIVLHDQTKPGYLVEITYLVFHLCQQDLIKAVLKLNSSLLDGKVITVKLCKPNLKYFDDHVKLKLSDEVGLSDSEMIPNAKPRSKKRSKKRSYEDTTGTDKGVKKSKRSSEKEMEVGDTSDSKKAELDTEKSCKCCEYLTKALPTLLTKDDLKDVFGKWERKWPSKHDTWIDKRPDLIPSPQLRGEEVDCLNVALCLHWRSLVRLSGCTTPEWDNISDRVPLLHQRIPGVVEHFIFARDFLIKNGYIDDMKVHSRPDDSGEWENFENVIDLLLAKAPLAVEINNFKSYSHHFSKDCVLSPTSTERVRVDYEKLPTHALLLVGKGVDLTGERPKRFYELLQPYGARYGKDRIVRLARGEGLIHTAVEMTLSTKKRASGMEAGDTSESKKAAESPENANQEQFNNSGKQLGSKNKDKGVKRSKPESDERYSEKEAGDTSESKKAAASPKNANQKQFNNSGKQLGSKNKGKGRA